MVWRLCNSGHQASGGALGTTPQQRCFKQQSLVYSCTDLSATSLTLLQTLRPTLSHGLVIMTVQWAPPVRSLLTWKNFMNSRPSRQMVNDLQQLRMSVGGIDLDGIGTADTTGSEVYFIVPLSGTVDGIPLQLLS